MVDIAATSLDQLTILSGSSQVLAVHAVLGPYLMPAGYQDNILKFAFRTAIEDAIPYKIRLNSGKFIASDSADAIPGDGNVVVGFSKGAAARTAILALDTASIGHAKIGLIGDDDLKISVSSDGVTYVDALSIDKITGTHNHRRARLVTGEVSPAQLIAHTHNYAISSIDRFAVLRLTGNADYDITGISSGAIGREMDFFNAGSTNLTFKNGSTSSDLLNRFRFNSDIVVYPGQVLGVRYDSSSAWIARTGAGGSTGGRTALQVISVTNASSFVFTTGLNNAAYGEFEISIERTKPAANNTSYRMIVSSDGATWIINANSYNTQGTRNYSTITENLRNDRAWLSVIPGANDDGGTHGTSSGYHAKATIGFLNPSAADLNPRFYRMQAECVDQDDQKLLIRWNGVGQLGHQMAIGGIMIYTNTTVAEFQATLWGYPRV